MRLKTAMMPPTQSNVSIIFLPPFSLMRKYFELFSKLNYRLRVHILRRHSVVCSDSSAGYILLDIWPEARVALIHSGLQELTNFVTGIFRRHCKINSQMCAIFKRGQVAGAQ